MGMLALVASSMHADFMAAPAVVRVQQAVQRGSLCAGMPGFTYLEGDLQVHCDVSDETDGGREGRWVLGLVDTSGARRKESGGRTVESGRWHRCQAGERLNPLQAESRQGGTSQ